MAKTKQVRWNGGPEDPDTITQHGLTFNKGEWTPVPDDIEKPKSLVTKLRNNPQFEVKGLDADEQPPGSDSTSTFNTGVPARAGVNSFKPVAVKNDKGKTVSWVIEGKNVITGANVPGPTDEYADEASAQVVCDGLNQVAP